MNPTLSWLVKKKCFLFEFIDKSLLTTKSSLFSLIKNERK